MSFPSFLFSPANQASATQAKANTFSPGSLPAAGSSISEAAKTSTGDAAIGRSANSDFAKSFRQVMAKQEPAAETKGKIADNNGKAADTKVKAADTNPKMTDGGERLSDNIGDIEGIANITVSNALELSPEILQWLAEQGIAPEMVDAVIQQAEQPLALKQIVSLLTLGSEFPPEHPLSVADMTDEPLDSETMPIVSSLIFAVPQLPDAGASALQSAGSVQVDVPLKAKVEIPIKMDYAVEGEGVLQDAVLEDGEAETTLFSTTSALKNGRVGGDNEARLNVAAQPPQTAEAGAFADTFDSLVSETLESFSSAVEGEHAPSAVHSTPNRSLAALETNAAGRVMVPVQVSFGHQQWSDAVAERAAWLAAQQINSAELQLDPPELGPLQVRISVQNDQAVVNFASANPQVREALEQTMARLREMLQEQGMQLVDAGVSDQRQSNGEAAQALEEGVAGDITGEADETSEVTLEVADSSGIDDFV